MDILVTNDDGIDSPGLWALAAALNRVGSVHVIAPDKQQSGSGTGVTMTRGGVNITEIPSRIRDVPAFTVNGTPCDCVFLGLRKLAPATVAMVASGINLGANVGNDIPFSGTVMATLAAHFTHIPSMAVSLSLWNDRQEMRFDAAGRIAETLARGFRDGSIQAEAILNVNVPNVLPESVKGIAVTRAARLWYRPVNPGSAARVSGETVDARPKRPIPEEGTDAWAIDNGYISITPLRLDITHHDLLPELSKRFHAIESGFKRQ